MSSFEPYECEACGDTFRAHPDANAAEKGFCSPACESEGRGLAA